MKLTVRPLTPDLWPAFADLFADSTTCQRCWCMYWRIGAAYRTTPAPARARVAFEERGFASTFARLGFKTVARHIPARPIMRHDLKVIANRGTAPA